MYPDLQAAVKSDDTAARELSGFTDRHQNLLGRYYDRIRLIPFTPDPYSVYLSEPSELVRTQGLKIFDRMLLDDMIASAVVGWISQILTDARWQPGGDSKECKDVADCLNASMSSLPGGLVACLFDVLFGAVYGFSVSTRPVQFIKEGQWRGYVGLKAIRYLEPHFLEPVFEGEHGDLVGWNQVDRSSGSTFFAEDEVIHFVHNRRRDPARGQSLILPAHPHWIAKTLLLQMRNYVAEWTIGKLVLRHDPSVKDAVSRSDFYTRAGDLIANYLTRSGFALPAGIIAELMSGNAEVSPDVFDSALKFCNQGILRTCSGNWTLSEEPETGSRALAETQGSVAGARFKVPREDFRSLIQRKVGDYLGKLNGWRPEHWAKFTLSPPIEDDRQARVTAYLAAVTAQAISVQPADENWLRESFGAPLVKETGGLVDTPRALGPVPAPGQPAKPASPMAGVPAPEAPESQVTPHPAPEKFASKPDWWNRPKTAGEMRCSFAQIDSGLQGIIGRGRDKMETEWGKALEAFGRRVTGWAESERVTPAQLLANINDSTLDLDGYEQALLNVSKQAWLFGAEHAAKELEASGAPSVKRPAALKFGEAKVAPDNPHSLGNFTALSKSRSFRVRKDKERQALSAIAVTLESAFNAGLTVPEAKAKLRDVYAGLASGKMIAPGTPGHDYTKDAVQETTVRTMAASAFGAARLDLYTRNDDWCLGTERSEVLGGKDGQRSHPLSKYVDGLKVRFSDPRYKQLSGCLAFNDRGVDIPLTQMDEPIEWSTDAEIEEALARKAELSPNF